METSLLAVAVGLLGLIAISLWVVLYQLVKQQGRFLLRIDSLEHRLAHAGHGDSAHDPAGLAVGTPLPSFRLPDLAGQEHDLEDFRGEKLLLVNWSPRCGYCEQVAPELARLEKPLDGRNVNLVLVAGGDAESNRRLAEEHGLTCPILLAGESDVEAFRGFGTPVAYLLDEEGRVALPVAIGADAVPALAGEAAGAVTRKRRLPGEKALSESRIERKGLRAGTPAPAFQLPGVAGGTVSLESYRGRKLLLVFSDPHCGPCEELAPHLVELHRAHRGDGLDILMVGRGDLRENRLKAQEHRFEFPVALQKRWELSREYGIFATPAAFLIDEKGTVAKNVATGVEEILELARSSLPY